MEKLEENYVVICEDKEQSDIVLNYLFGKSIDWYQWKYIAVSENRNSRYDDIENVKMWFKGKSYKTYTFKEWNDIVNNNFPELWYIELNEETVESINKVRALQINFKNPLKVGDYKFCINNDYCDSVTGDSNIDIYKKYKKINIKQFNKHFNITMKNKDNWCIKKNTHQDVCDWFNESERESILKGTFKYLVNRKYNYLSDKIPEGFREINLEEFYQITNMKKEFPKYWAVKTETQGQFNAVLKYINEFYGVSNKYTTGFEDRVRYLGTSIRHSFYDPNMNFYSKLEEFNNPELVELSFQEFEKLINMEKEFKLPAKWCIKMNEQLIIDYCNEYGGMPPYSICNSYAHFPCYDLNCTSSSEIKKGYVEISFEQFNKYVLNKKTMKTLPDNWKLKITSESLPFINQVRKSQRNLVGKLDLNDIAVSLQMGEIGFCGFSDKDIEIDVETFKHFYLKETIKKGIVLTRQQLVDLHKANGCSDWKKEIESILSFNLLSDTFEIPQKSIDYLIKDGSDEQKELVKDLGIELPKSEKEQYLENQANCGFKIGDVLKIVRKAESLENGWGNSWMYDMDNHVGKTVTVRNISDKGIRFNEIDNAYPYFVLEKYVEEYIPFDFSDDLLGMKIISKDKSCKGIIGYQTNDRVVIFGSFFTSYETLLKDYTFLNGSVCGKLKQ